MDKYTEIVKEIQRGNQEARNMLENQLKQDYQYMVANVNDLAQAEGLLRSAIASAMANITSTSSPDGIGESVRRNLEWNLTRASQVRRDYNQGNNYGDGTVTFSRSGTYSMNNNPQGGYAGPAGYRNNGYVQQNTYNDRTNNYNQTNNFNGNNNAGYGQQSNINNGAGYGQRSNINNGSGYGQQNNINNAARPQTPSNTAPKTNNKKNFIKYALIGAGILAIIIIGIVLYNVFFKDNSSKKVVSGIDDNTGNSTEDYSYQDDTEDTSYNDTETSDNNIASDTGYEIVIEDYFYYYSNEDAEGMKLCSLDCQPANLICISDPIKKSNFRSKQKLWGIRYVFSRYCLYQTLICMFPFFKKMFDSILVRIKVRCRDHSVYTGIPTEPKHLYGCFYISASIVNSRKNMGMEIDYFHILL